MSEPKQIGQNTEGYAKVVHREFPTGEEYLLKSSQVKLVHQIYQYKYPDLRDIRTEIVKYRRQGRI